MKLLFKQRFSWFDNYNVYDEFGNVIYVVKQKLSWRHELVIYDADGRKVGMVIQKVLTLLPKFEIYKNELYMGCIKRNFSFLGSHYNIEYNGWGVDGSILELNYIVYDRSGSNVARISKELFNFTDTYVLDINDFYDSLDVLMFVLAIDAEKCSRKK